MKPNNLTFLFPKPPDEQLEDEARRLAHNLSDTYWPHFEWEGDRIVMLYQTRYRYLELVLSHDHTILFEGKDTTGKHRIEGTVPLKDDYGFLIKWLNSDRGLTAP